MKSEWNLIFHGLSGEGNNMQKKFKWRYFTAHKIEVVNIFSKKLIGQTAQKKFAVMNKNSKNCGQTDEQSSNQSRLELFQLFQVIFPTESE